MSNYNFGLTTFDQSGKLTQLDNSLKAVSNGDTSLGKDKIIHKFINNKMTQNRKKKKK